jgi:hypothetical protein
MAALKYLLGAAGLTVAYLYTSYLTDKNNMFEGKPVLSYMAWLNVKYLNNIGAPPEAYKDIRTIQQEKDAVQLMREGYDPSKPDLGL